MPQRPDRVRRQWRIPAAVPLVVALMVCGALVAFVAASADDDESPPATTTSTAPPTTSEVTTTTEPVPDPIDLAALTVDPLPEDTPAAYRIEYDIVENALDRHESWTVRRPYESLVLATRQDQLVSGSATSRTDLYTYVSERDGWFAIQPELHRAAYDQHPLTVMATMIALGFAEVGGEAEYLGRPCTVYVTGPPMASGSVAAATERERTETCIDGQGLVLHERWTIDGDVVTERTATAVEIDPAVDAAVFDPQPEITDAPELDALLGTIAVAADEETLAGLRTDIVVPEGYEYDGAVFRSNTSDTGGTGASETVRFYRRGPDLVEVAEITVGGPAELDGGGALPLEIEGYDEVWFDPDFRVSAIRARLTETSFVEIRGADPSVLADLLLTISVR